MPTSAKNHLAVCGNTNGNSSKKQRQAKSEICLQLRFDCLSLGLPTATFKLLLFADAKRF